MLADDGHVTIDGVSYVLAEDEEPHYNHRFESLFSPTQAIAGEIAKDQIRPEKLLWAWTDWSGGEGGRIYYPSDPTRYDFGTLVNGTVRGQLTTRARRRRSAVPQDGAFANRALRSAGVSAYASALIGWSDNIVASTDAVSWGAAQDATPDMFNAHYADAITDGDNAAFLRLSGGESFAIPVVAAGVSTASWENTNVSSQPDGATVGCVVDGVAYTIALLSGATEYAIFKATYFMEVAQAWDNTEIFRLGVHSAGTWGTNHWTSMTSAETALYASYSTPAQGFVWEVRQDVGRPFWTAPRGFAIKKLIYHVGILFAIGNQTAAGKSFGGIWAIPLATRSPIFIGAPRKHQNTELTDFSVGCAGAGPQIFVADRVSGKIFVYDIPLDALHLFDDLAQGGTGDGLIFDSDERISFLAMHGNRLFGATDTVMGGAPPTNLQVFTYDDLEPVNRDASQAITGSVVSPEWDFGVPMELKALIGFYVTFKVTDSTTASGLVANSRIQLAYQTDDGGYVDMAVIDKDTTPSGAQGRVFQQVSTGDTTVKFSRLKIMVILDNNSAAAAPPVVFGVTAEAQLMAYAETWDLAVRVEDEDSNEGPTSRQNSGSFLRDHLESLAINKNVVTFQDGYRYKQNATYTEHTVVVEDPADTIVTNGEGVMRVKLRAIL